MIDGTAYAQSLECMNSVVFIYGKRVESFWQHPVMKPAFNCLKETYDLTYDPAHNPALHELIVTESPLTGGRISRFLHVIQSREDLLARMKMQRSLMRHTGGCFGGRCVAGAVINALWSVTYDVDRENAGMTEYHERFRSFLKTAQQRDLTVMGNITDAKGDRSLPPHRQADPDLFVRIVERRPEKQRRTGGKDGAHRPRTRHRAGHIRRGKEDSRPERHCPDQLLITGERKPHISTKRRYR